MKRHLKRLAAPATWNIERKKTTFIVRPFPSGHKMEMSIPLGLLMTEMGNYAKTTKEVKTILQHKSILVNGRRRTNPRATAGFLDLVQIGEGEILRIILNKKGKIVPVKVPVKEAGIKVSRITGKTMCRGNKIQVSLNDGNNYFLSQKEKYKVGDSVVIDLKNNKIVDHLPFEKNMIIFLARGKQVGSLGKVIEISAEDVIVKLESGLDYKTKKENAIVVGKEHPVITVQSAE